MNDAAERNPWRALGLCLLAAAILWPFWPVSAATQRQTTSRRVLALQSYHKGFSWTDDVQRGIETVFKESGEYIEIAVEYMDAKRHPVRQVFDKLADLYEFKYRRWQPDLIISCDDDALAFLFEYRDRIYPGVPVVFCGLDVDSYDPSMLKGRQGYTGVVARLDLTGTIDLILDLQPAVDRIAVVHDWTTSGRAHRRSIQLLAPRYGDAVEFIYPNSGPGLTEAELLSYLRGLDARSAVYFLAFSRDRLDNPLPLDHIIPLISQASPVPVYTHVDAYFGYGTLGGKLLSAEIHGRSTANKALRLLEGTPVPEVPVSVERSNHYVFDYRQLRRFSIPESRLPEGSVVAFAPTHFLDRHRTGVLWAAVGILGLMAFTTALVVNIVRRRRVETALRQSEEKFQKAFHSCPVFMSISTLDEGRFLEVNAEFMRLMDLSREEVIGRKAADVGLWEKTGREPVLAELKQKGHAHHKEIEIRSKSGEKYHLLWFGDVVAIGGRQCLVVTGYDQTDRKRAEEELLIYRRIVSANPDAMAYLDQAYRYRIVNDAYETFSDTKQEAFIGKTVPEYLGEDIFREKIKTHFDRCLEGETIQYEDWFEYPTLGRRYVQITYFPFRDDEKVVRGIVANTRDITELKLAEDKIRQYADHLEEMVAERTHDLEKAQEELILKERLAVLGNLSGSISHELRNPLAAIDSSVYLLKLKYGDDDNAASHLQRIAANVGKANGIIQSLLDLTRMEGPRTRTRDLRDLIPDLLRGLGAPDGIRIKTDYADAEVPADVDARQIRMALKNFMENAIQAMDGDGTLSVSVLRTESGESAIVVSDTGPGIPPEEMKKIFQPLFSTRVHGIGFGLSIAKMIIEKHGGDLTAESIPGEGATFTVALPRVRKEAKRK